jgi:hypothetical protein
MKKIYTFFMVFGIAITLKAQLVVNENFSSYSNGNLSGQPFGWIATGAGTDVQVATATPLVRSGYTSGTQYVTVSNTDGIDPYKTFSASINTGVDRTIYMSFLVRVNSAKEFNAGGPNYSVALINTGNAVVPLRFYIGEENGTSTNIEFGIALGTSGPNYTNGDFNYNTTYLIVIRYDVVSATGTDDDAYLWVNPSLTSQPALNAATGPTGATVSNATEVGYGSTLDALQISQSSTTASPVAAYDGFRVATGLTADAAWTNLSPAGASLPVKLNNFNAAKEGSNVKLVWRTEEEMNVSNYIIERSVDGRNYSVIGTVGAGNKINYSFTDLQPASDYNFYRLKIMNEDGTYRLSHIVSIKSKAAFNISLSPNPVRGSLLVQHPKVSTPGRLQVLNTEGKVVKSLQVPANAVLTTVDMSGLPNALYHVVFRNEATIFTKMVLKQ